MKKFLVVFPCDTLSYSPTMLNMIEMLSECGNVDLLTFWDKRVESVGRKLPCRIFYIRIPSLMRRLLQRVFGFYCWLKAFLLYAGLKWHRDEYDLIFAVDSLGYFVTSKVYKRRVIYVSLEIYDDIWLALTKRIGVDMLLIQSQARKQFLFGDDPISYRILPNSSREMPTPPAKEQRGFRLIYMGAIYPVHGVEFCIEALNVLPERFSLTLKGVVSARYKNILRQKYGALMETGRLSIDDTYVPQDSVVDYLRSFDAGLCLYDIEGKLSGNFNYISCPSGKMYSYFAAGLPVIGQDILGLQDVADHDAGILIARTSPQDIAEAVLEVFSDYGRFAKGALSAGEALCFEPHFNVILSELLFSGELQGVENA